MRGALLVLAGCCACALLALSIWQQPLAPQQLSRGRRLQGAAPPRPSAARASRPAQSALQLGTAAAAAKPGGGAAPQLPQCMWNEVKETCSPGHLVYLSLSAAPVTLLHRAAVFAYDRNLVCNGRADEASCAKDRANRCMYWNKSCVGMDSYELVNWLGGGDKLNGDAAILDFTCPGTDAAAYKACKTASDAGPTGVCNQLPGCQFVPLIKECVPKAFDARSLKQVQALQQQFAVFDPRAWGSCPGACYVRQAAQCAKSYNSSSSCAAKPYCAWEFDAFDARKVCMHKDTAARGSDAFSQQYAAIKAACTKLTTQEACEAPRIVARNAGKYRTAGLPPQPPPSVAAEAAAKCVL